MAEKGPTIVVEKGPEIDAVTKSPEKKNVETIFALKSQRSAATKEIKMNTKGKGKEKR